MTIGRARHVRPAVLRTAQLRSLPPEGIPSPEEFRAQTRRTMQLAAYRTEGRWAERIMQQLEALVRPLSWSRPADHGCVVEALTAGRLVPAHAWQPQPVDFGSIGEQVADLVERVVTVAHPVREAVAATAEEAYATVHDIAESRLLVGADSNALFTDWSLRRYGRPSPSSLQTAHRALAAPPAPPTPPTWDTEQAAAAVTEVLAQVAPGWTVAVRPILAAMMVDNPSATVVLSSGRQFTDAQLARLLVHEIGAHVLRSVNARAAEGSFAGISLGNDAAATEEGLAVWWERRVGIDDPATMRTYAARAIAVDVALTGSISDVMDALVPSLPPGEAAQVAVRVKRGLRDPMQPGALTKDHAYWSGADAVSAYLERSPDRLGDLMATKWGLSLQPMVTAVRAEGLLAAELRLPDAQVLLSPLERPRPGGSRR